MDRASYDKETATLYRKMIPLKHEVAHEGKTARTLAKKDQNRPCLASTFEGMDSLIINARVIGTWRAVASNDLKSKPSVGISVCCMYP